MDEEALALKFQQDMEDYPTLVDEMFAWMNEDDRLRLNKTIAFVILGGDPALLGYRLQKVAANFAMDKITSAYVKGSLRNEGLWPDESPYDCRSPEGSAWIAGKNRNYHG